eukprot:TRINITY_DN1737_c0_g2_i1.p1 TRINITY_DN1737_c0_g2~~TRINITY_DN1737_c0_g2_i1.p1  ORF type:complete len:119 (+),score=5.00 TRINITY_DN1737_c0_g2_i1:337-693(+)
MMSVGEIWFVSFEVLAPRARSVGTRCQYRLGGVCLKSAGPKSEARWVSLSLLRVVLASSCEGTEGHVGFAALIGACPEGEVRWNSLLLPPWEVFASGTWVGYNRAIEKSGVSSCMTIY